MRGKASAPVADRPALRDVSRAFNRAGLAARSAASTTTARSTEFRTTTRPATCPSRTTRPASGRSRRTSSRGSPAKYIHETLRAAAPQALLGVLEQALPDDDDHRRPVRWHDRRGARVRAALGLQRATSGSTTSPRR